MRIFLGFFGLTRSLRYTLSSIRAQIFDPLAASGIEAPRFGHFHLPDAIFNRRSGEFGIPTDRTDATLLQLQHCQIDAQDPALIKAALTVAQLYPDRQADDYASARNLCFQLRSLDQLWTMLADHIADQDRIVFLRPDLHYLDPLDLPAIIARMDQEKADLAVPAWQDWGGLNDRFAIATPRGARSYATRLQWLEAAAAAADGVHAESLLQFAAAMDRLRVMKIPSRAVRIRANGLPAMNDLICFGLHAATEPAGV